MMVSLVTRREKRSCRRCEMMDTGRSGRVQGMRNMIMIMQVIIMGTIINIDGSREEYDQASIPNLRLVFGLLPDQYVPVAFPERLE